MLDKGILGYIVGFFLGSFGSREKLIELGRKSCIWEEPNSKYIPPYSGHYINRGDCDNEDWYYKELLYKRRYVNVVDKGEYYLVSIDWMKKRDSIAYYECNDMRDAEVEAEYFYLEYSPIKEVKCKNTKASYFIYTIETKDKIIIKVTAKEDKDMRKHRLQKETNHRILDSIKCLDEDEVIELIDDMKYYYESYKIVEVQMDFMNKELYM